MRCQQLEYEEQVEKERLKRQLESAIRERREAEKKELLEKLRPLSQSNQADIPRITDTSLPELVSPSDSGDGSGEEKDTEKNGQGCGKRQGHKPPRDLKKTRRISQSRSKKVKNHGTKETLILQDLVKSMGETKPPTHIIWSDATIVGTQKDTHNQNSTPPLGGTESRIRNQQFWLM